MMTSEKRWMVSDNGQKFRSLFNLWSLCSTNFSSVSSTGFPTYRKLVLEKWVGKISRRTWDLDLTCTARASTQDWCKNKLSGRIPLLLILSIDYLFSQRIKIWSTLFPFVTKDMSSLWARHQVHHWWTWMKDLLLEYLLWKDYGVSIVSTHLSCWLL